MWSGPHKIFFFFFVRILSLCTNDHSNASCLIHLICSYLNGKEFLIFNLHWKRIMFRLTFCLCAAFATVDTLTEIAAEIPIKLAYIRATESQSVKHKIGWKLLVYEQRKYDGHVKCHNTPCKILRY